MANFQVENLDAEYDQTQKIAYSAELTIYTSPLTSLTAFGQFAEYLTILIFELDGLGDYSKQYDRINLMRTSSGDYPHELITRLEGMRKYRNKSTHAELRKKYTNEELVKLALAIDKYAVTVWEWFINTYTQETVAEYQTPVNHEQLTAEQEQQIQAQEKRIAELEAQIDSYQPKLSPIDLTPEAKVKRKKLNQLFAKNHPLTEAENRRLIDNQLREVGWEVDTNQLTQANGARPEKNKNKAISEWRFNNGKKADYALFIGKQFVGIVEAKKPDETVSTSALQQSYDYFKDAIEETGEEVPFIYSTNGRPYLAQVKTESGIWFWNARNPKHAPEALPAWHSPDDLKQKLSAKPEEDANQELHKDADFPEFANRKYQIEAIQAIESAVANHQSRILLAMATGTGKTRTAISLMYRLLKHKRARRILYLVDRQSLATQTNNALTDNRIEQQSISSIFGVKTFEEILPEMTTKIQIATVQGMVKRLFHNGETEITPGMYDFVIVDEAHRGYFEDKEMTDDEMEFYDHNDYVSQYRRVVDYFDAVAIGMTATPTLNTIKIFGNPVYSYSYRQAVLDGYLMDHDAPIILETEQSQNGLHFKKGAEVTVFDYDSHQVDTDVLSDDIDFEVDDFNIKVDNTGFNREIASYLTKQLDPNDPELGKTLIFATRDSHADKIVSLLNEAFEAADNPVPINAIMKITGKDRHREDHIKQFNNEQFPNIVVTVDLLTTGIDIPSITNLVFLRRVKSRVLFEQMLGRATRLCPDVEVDHFKIYDAVGQYKAMKSFTAMNQVIQSKNINRSIKELYELAVGATSEDAYHEYLEQLTAKLQRKCSRLSSEQINELEDGLQIPDLLGWVRNLQTLTLGELSQFEEEINVLNDYRVMKRRVIVSYDEDQVVSDKPGFGNDGVTTSSDYLEEFNQFVQHAVNEKVGIYVTAKSRPRDLKLQDLQEIERVLVFKGFNETDLQKAWKQEHHQNTAANIISFIRQAALGTPLQDEDELISRAMKKVYNLADWNDKQKKWLRRIERQLRENNVLGPTAKMAFNDNDIFREKGGYNRINKDLDGKADEIINLINDVMFG